MRRLATAEGGDYKHVFPCRSLFGVGERIDKQPIDLPMRPGRLKRYERTEVEVGLTNTDLDL